MKLSPPNGAQGQIDNPWRILETIFLKRLILKTLLPSKPRGFHLLAGGIGR
jgi:hypothetical protein